ncbi:MAG: hypothetical protein GEV06_23135 [Luteitalea sp.]|nr:hypothetical protein [Luteitalea sp.]
MNHWMQAGISVLLLAALAVAPVSGAVCAVRCASAGNQPSQDAGATSMPHATTTKDCHGRPASGAAQVSAEAAHPCGDHDGIREDRTASLLPGRDDTSLLLQTVAATAASPPSEVEALEPPAALSAWRSLRPPVAPPAPTRATVVLRI